MADFVSEPFAVRALAEAHGRVDVELGGVDQAVPSYEGRLFLNNPEADRETIRDEDSGYLGSFFVFGKVQCWGEDEGHCDPASDRRFDRRHPPGRHAKIRVTVPEGRLARLIARGAEQATISVVAVRTSDADASAAPSDGPLRFGRLSVIAYG